MHNLSRLLVIVPLLFALAALAGCARDEPYLVIYEMDQVDERLGEVENRYREANTAGELDTLSRKVSTETAEVEGQYKNLHNDVRSIQQNLEWLEAKYGDRAVGSEPPIDETPVPEEPSAARETPASDVGPVAVNTPIPTAVVETSTDDDLPALMVVPTLPPPEELARLAAEATGTVEAATPVRTEMAPAVTPVESPIAPPVGQATPASTITADTPAPVPMAVPTEEPTQMPAPEPTVEPTAEEQVARGEKDPASVDLTKNEKAAFQRAMAFHEAGDCARSVEELYKFLENFPHTAQSNAARVAIAECLMRQNRFHAAMVYLREIEIDAQDILVAPKALLLHGRCLEKTNRMGDAVEKYKELRAIYPESPEAETARARMEKL